MHENIIVTVEDTLAIIEQCIEELAHLDTKIEMLAMMSSGESEIFYNAMKAARDKKLWATVKALQVTLQKALSAKHEKMLGEPKMITVENIRHAEGHPASTCYHADVYFNGLLVGTFQSIHFTGDGEWVTIADVNQKFDLDKYVYNLPEMKVNAGGLGHFFKRTVAYLIDSLVKPNSF